MVDTGKQLRTLWKGLCSIYQKKKEIDPTTGQTKLIDSCTHENIPCRLSFSRISPATEGNVSAATQAVKLFLSPDIKVVAGSKLAVTQNGITTDYAQSGTAAVYSAHQEIPLELFRGWA